MGLSHGKIDSGATNTSFDQGSKEVFHPVPGGYPTGPGQVGITNSSIASEGFGGPGPIILYVFFSFVAFCCLLYTIIRQTTRASSKVIGAGSKRKGGRDVEAGADEETTTQQFIEEMVGYRNNFLGDVCNTLTCCVYPMLGAWYVAGHASV